MILWLAILTALGAETSEAEKAFEPSFDGTLIGEHYSGFSYESGPRSTLMLDLIGTPAEEHTFRLIQPVDKLYEIPEIGGEEFVVKDTILYHYFKPKAFQDIRGTGVKLGWRTGVTLPVRHALEDESINNGKISRFSGRLSVSRNFLKDHFTVSLRPISGTYHLNEYKQGAGGLPHTLMAVGPSLYVIYRPHEILEFHAVASYSHLIRERVAAQVKDLPNDEATYGYEAFALIKPFPDLVDVRLGISRSDDQMKNGRFEILPFEERSTSWYGAVDLKF